MFLLLFALYLFLCCDRVVRSSVEIREENEEDRRVKKKKSCYQFWVATVEDQGLRAVYEHQEELHLEMKRKYVELRCLRLMVSRILLFVGKSSIAKSFTIERHCRNVYTVL